MNEQQVQTKKTGPTSKARVVVVETVYHQAGSGETLLVEARFSRVLKSDEQPYGPRRLMLSSAWIPLDVGWVDRPGFVVVKNESTDTAVELGVAGTTQGLLTIAPGESLRFQPVVATAWHMRSQGESVRCALTVLPQ